LQKNIFLQNIYGYGDKRNLGGPKGVTALRCSFKREGQKGVIVSLLTRIWKVSNTLMAPQFKLGRTKLIFCPLKFRWGTNPIGPPRIIILSPQIQFINITGHANSVVAEMVYVCTILLLIQFVAIYALLGGPALTISSWLGDRNQFIEPGSRVRS